ncbi:YhgE/Pip domain-containing protein [Neobacillus sp. PS3-40]|uniref:YhgE/Pip domain-containing protein n=1 Tax=Neobacillus sp. PS3-40 TaxID=3070679 RepID=UPI0027DF4EEB|nr:YhgE/Pip domain-containing protein [Neobacillus sp. PS3-40]WML42658.1 YhgE/Pip domain-containing protein [Neobacillus sp. PS3-40]
MKIFTSLKSEFLGIIHNRKLLIALIGVMTIPLLYSGTFLWAFWNPYGHLDRMPVAIVNQDQGATYNGERLEIGHDLVENLKKKKSFNWKFVNEEKASKGLKDQKFYLKIEIPKDFSENATTLQSTNPKKLKIIYSPNEGFNYLSSKIGDSAIEKIKEEVSSAVTKTYAESVFANIKDVAKGLDKAGSGTDKLYDGINKAKKGSGDLKKGIESAKSGSADLNVGANSLGSGAKKIEQNLEILAEKSISFSNGLTSASIGSKQLQNGLEQFDKGLSQMESGNDQLQNGAVKSQVGAKQLTDGLNSVVTKLPDLQNGSKQLADGSTQLSSSIELWSKGAQETKQGAATVSGGLEQVVQQVGKMAEESTDPTEKAKLENVVQSLQQLSVGSQKVAGGVTQLSDNALKLQQATTQIATGASQLNQGQTQLVAGLSKLDKGAVQLQDGQNQLVAGLTVFGGKIGEAKNGVSQLVSGNNSLTAGLDQLAVGSIKLGEGTNQLEKGSKQLVNGTNQLSEGTKSLTSGITKLGNGSNGLTSGLEKLTVGSKELADQLHNGAKDVKEVKANNAVYNMFAKPVTLVNERLNHVPDYGTGFTPYFLSLSLFVGALMLSIVFPLLEPATEPKSGFSWFVGKLGVLLSVGIVQALLADLILLEGLGLEVKSIPYFILLSIFTSWTFLAIIQFLVTVLDNPGRFLGVIILILQLTSSAGTYPIELVPNVLQKITHFLPMTYTIAGFRSVISTGDFGAMWKDFGSISVFFVGFLAATLAFFIIKFNRQKSRTIDNEKTCVAI